MNVDQLHYESSVPGSAIVVVDEAVAEIADVVAGVARRSVVAAFRFVVVCHPKLLHQVR